MKTPPFSLVVIDNDGCLVRDEFSTYDLGFVERMRSYGHRAEEAPGRPVPRFTFITGRPQPYVECLQKLFDVAQPAIFENGAGLDFGGQSRSALDPRIDEAALERLAAARVLLRRTVMRDIPSFFQPGKDGSISVIPQRAEDRQRLYEECLALAERERLGLQVIRGVRCADLVLPGIDKGTGFRWLLDTMHLNAEEVAGIGDSRGDLRFLRLCGWTGAPANAVEEVRACATYVSPYEAEWGVIDIVEAIIRNNEMSGA